MSSKIKSFWSSSSSDDIESSLPSMKLASLSEMGHRPCLSSKYGCHIQTCIHWHCYFQP
jgi:hypothetical protein